MSDMYARDHWKVHSKEKPFCCPACCAYFGRDRDLVKHKQSQKHKKAIQLHGLSTQNVTPSTDTNSRTLGPTVRTRGGGPGGFSRPSRGRRAAGNGRRHPAAAAATGVAGHSHGGMEVSGDDADGTAQPPSDSAAGGNLTQANMCTSSRSVKRMRTISDIDTNNGVENSTEAPKGPGSESFGAGASPISPAASRSLAPYPPRSPSRSNHNRSSLSRSRSNLQSRIPDTSTNVSSAASSATRLASSNVPAIAFNTLHRPAMLSVAESQCGAWVHAATDDRTTASSVGTDDYMQLYVDMDYDPSQTTHAPQQPNLWHTGDVDTFSTIPTEEYSRDLLTRPYRAESDGHG